jgi:hypothetical protein
VTLLRCALLICLAGTACAETLPPPPADMPMIEVQSGGAFSGGSTIRIRENDQVETSTRPPGGAVTTKVVQGKPGVYAAALEKALATLPQLKQPSPEDLCMDYGIDSVTLIPPVGGVSGIAVACPDDDVTALMDAIIALIRAPG